MRTAGMEAFMLAAALALAGVVCALPAAADNVSSAASADAPGDAIIATAEGDAQIVWDSTEDVERIVRDKLPDDAAKALLERDALRVISSNLKDLKKATSITVNVHFNKTAAVNPAYDGATFVGVERYALVTMDAHDADTDAGKWQQLGATASIPSFVKCKITGQLPPR